jgi:hypothetical protein
MLNGLRNLVKKNGHNGANGHKSNGHGANGHDPNDDSTVSLRPGSNGSNGHNGLDDSHCAVPTSNISVTDEFLWSLEVRRDQELLGTMHSSNPFVLISFFRDYSMLYGEPAESYAVWIRCKESNRGAPMQYQEGEAAWVEFLSKIDPEIERNLDDLRATRDRTSMLDPDGRPTHPDAVFELAFGLGG